MNINLNNYEEYLLNYVDGELEAEDEKELLQFMGKYPELEKELQLLQATKLPDDKMVFPYKQQLYRSKTPGKKKVIVLNKIWLGAAVAASVALLIIAYFSINRSYKPSTEFVFNHKITKQGMDTFKISMPLPVQPTAPKEQKHLAITDHSGKKTEHKRAIPKKTEIKQQDTSTILYAQTNVERENNEKIIPIAPVRKLFKKDTITMLKEADLAKRAQHEVEKNVPVPVILKGSTKGNKKTRSQSSFSYTKEDIDSIITDKIVAFQHTVSHPLEALKGKKIKIGSFSFVFKK